MFLCTFTLPETNIAPKNGWLMMVGIRLSYWGGLFSGAMSVSGRVIYRTHFWGQLGSEARLLVPFLNMLEFSDVHVDTFEVHLLWGLCPMACLPFVISVVKKQASLEK